MSPHAQNVNAARLSAEGLAVGHGGRVLAGGIDFALAAGEIVCVLGPNGAGKTTLLRTLLGLHGALAGRVRADGADLRELSPAARARRLAYVPQSMAGGFNFAVIDYVSFARVAHLAWYAAPSRRDLDRALCALETVGLARLAERDLATLSGGERQLVRIARALAAEARTLLLDEPTASLDFGNRARVLEIALRLKAEGYAVLMTTHHPDEALRIAERTLTMARDGSVHFGETRAVVTAERLTALYGVPVELVAAADGRILPVA